jgi:OOP family OmpA-OmpF porin
MCQPRKWWQGLVPLAFLWLLTLWFNTGAVEQDLTIRTAVALGAVTLDAPNVILAGRDATVSADAFSTDGQHAAIAAIEDTKGVRRVTDATKLVPEMHPYAWAVQRDGNKLTITGNAPAPEVRAQIVDAAKKAVPGGEIVDQMAWARGAPAAFGALTAFELGELGKLAMGSANLADGQIAISGEAPTSDAYGQVVADLTKLPEGASLGKIAIVPPEVKPFVWGAMREGGKVIINGSAPIVAVRTDLVEAAKNALPGTEIVDQMTWGRGAPADFSAIAAFLFTELSKLSSGKAGLVDKQISITGEAPTSAAYEQVLADLRALPGGAVLGGANLLPPEAKPFVWSVTRDGRAVVVSGDIASPEARSQLLQAVKKTVPDAEVNDQLTYARGAPAGFIELTSFGLTELGKLAKGTIRFSDTSIALEGEAPTSAAYEDILADLTKLPSGATVTKAEVQPPLAAPFSLMVVREGGTLTLTGTVPNAAARAQLVDTAKRSVPNVVDHLAFARGAPAAFDKLAAFGLSQIGWLASGSVALLDNQISIAGEAASSAAYEAVQADLKKLPDGGSLGKADVVPPPLKPYRFAAAREGQTLTLSGAVPDSDARAQVLDMAKKTVPGATIADQLIYARGAPSALTAMAGFGLAEIGKVSKGSATIVDKDISLSGEAPTSAVYEQVLADLKKLPAGATLGKVDFAAPLAQPYVWTASRDGTSVSLAGDVPSPDTRAQLLEAAKKIAGAAVTDHMTIARGAPANFAAIATYGLDALSNLATGTFGLSDMRLTIEGEASTSDDFDRVAGSLSKLPDRTTLAKASVLPPLAQPFTWSAKREGSTLTIDGNVPSADVRSALTDLAKKLFTGAKIDDQMTYARGAPINWSAAAEIGLQQLARMNVGQASLSDSSFSLNGAASDAAIQSAIEEAIRVLPNGFALAAHTITAPEPPPVQPESPAEPTLPPPPAPLASPPEASFRAVREAGALTLSGAYPDEKAHEDIVDAAQRKFFAEIVVDQMQQSDNAQRSAVSAALAGLDELSHLASGSVAVAGTVVKLSGAALYGKVAAQIQATARETLPTGYKMETELTVKPPEAVTSADACQKLFIELVSRGKIRFETGRATIQKDSFGLLDFAVYNALRCQAGNIEIAGHTDTDGSKDTNLELSKKRAQAVVDYLVKAGIESQRLSSVGYGDTRPIASNDNEEGKAENRRIEFSVK